VPRYQRTGDLRPVTPDHAGDLEFLLFRQSGVLGRRQALRHLTDKAIRHRLTTGQWRHAHRAVYVTHAGPITDDQRRWIASLGVGGGRPTFLAGLSALAVLGMRGYPSQRIHVIVPARRRDSDPPPGVVVHRTRSLPREDRHPAGCPPCTMPARSLVDAAQWARSDEDAVAIIAAGFQQRLVGVPDLAPVLARMPRLRRRRVIAAAVRDAAAGAESISEIDFARLCRRGGLPEPSRQVVRRDRDGRTRYRDAYFDEWRVHVEVDGGQHMEVRAWYADMRQQNEIVIAGERLLRFPAWMIRHRPEEVLAQIRAALIAAGWQP
jgi:hypothetical protein